MEIWRPVNGTDGMLEISSEGRIKSNLRDGRILKQQIDKKGYHRLRVTLNRVKMGFKVHRMVAEAFIPNPENLPQVNHIDGNKDNNSVSNLEWVSNRDNAKHAIESGLWNSVVMGAKAENDSRKVPVIATEKDGTKRRFESIRAAEVYYNSRHISDVLKGKRDHAAGCKFERG